VQNSLFTVGAELAASINKAGPALKGRITEGKVKDLEEAIEELGATLPDMKKFVLPGGSVGGAQLQLSRAICRRAERSVVAAGSDQKLSAELMKYMNRLSSFLFVAALHVNMKEGAEELNPVY
jgi:cob(I)alamin adenosyltransferase